MTYHCISLRTVPVKPGILSTLLLTSLLCASPVLAGVVAEGSVRLGEADWKVVDAIAHTNGDEILIAFSNETFDREVLLADGVIGPFDLMRHDGNRLAITVDSEGPGMCLHYYTRSGDTQFSGSTCNSDYPPAITIDTQTDHRIAGSMRWGDAEDEHVHLRFDLPIVPGASASAASVSESDSDWEATPGEPLPADGGEPGKAVLAHYQAVNAGDWEQLKSVSHPEGRSMMEETERSGEHLEMFEFLQAFTATNVSITGGTLDGDDAWILLKGEMDGSPVLIRALAVRFEGSWYFSGDTVRDD